MAFEGCPMYGGYGGTGGYFLNWIIGALIFSAVFWAIYYLLIKNKVEIKIKGGKK